MVWSHLVIPFVQLLVPLYQTEHVAVADLGVNESVLPVDRRRHHALRPPRHRARLAEIACRRKAR